MSAGVDEVQYIEPYPKSRTFELHGDAITQTRKGWEPPSSTADKQENSTVLFRPFTGFAPRMYRRMMNKHTATVLKFTSPSFAITSKTLSDTTNSYSHRDQHFVVLMAESDVAHTNSFLQFLNAFRPKIIFDLRLSPRLDFAGGSRRRAFRAFEEFSVQYIDVLGRLGVSSREEFFTLDQDAAPTLFSWIETDADDNRPIVCLYADDTIISQCKKIFKNDIQYYKQRRPETHISQFRAGLLEF